MKLANIVVYKGDGEAWTPLTPSATPEWLKEPDIMGEMIAGYIVERDGDFYRAKKLGDSKIVLSQGKAVLHRRPTIQ